MAPVDPLPPPSSSTSSEDAGVPTLADLDPAIAAVLAQLAIAARAQPPAPWSLARLGKQAALAMSRLRRALAALAEAGLVVIDEADPVRPMAALTPAGEAWCATLFPSLPPSPPSPSSSPPPSMGA